MSERKCKIDKDDKIGEWSVQRDGKVDQWGKWVVGFEVEWELHALLRDGLEWTISIYPIPKTASIF